MLWKTIKCLKEMNDRKTDAQDDKRFIKALVSDVFPAKYIKEHDVADYSKLDAGKLRFAHDIFKIRVKNDPARSQRVNYLVNKSITWIKKPFGFKN